MWHWFAAAVLVAPATPSLPDGIDVQRRDETVAIEIQHSGRFREALAALDRQLGSHARTRVDYEIVVNLLPSPGGGCRLDQPRTRLDLHVVRPVLAEVPAPSAFVRRTWGPIGRPLAIHEEGHVDIGVAAVAEHHRQAVSAMATPFKDCVAARRWLGRTAWRAEMRQQMAHDRYDRRTAFGARQGAVLRLEPRRY
ncbi:MAG: DUF922 domain-containing Zn-dependent protease [Xanthomonadaceae bacterium]|nr:DUF922 domain-containing Zn-dependent protease [Xanthomonadaceae bacterium]MCZ8319003.1 DUF922 domain-containing protein [Silanimonas sp.]